MSKHSKTISPSKTIEKILLRISILGLLSLILIQFFLSNDMMRSVVGTNNNGEVIAIENSATYNPPGWIEVEIENLHRFKYLSVLINGKEVEDLFMIDNLIKMEVYNGDVVEIDATDYSETIKMTVIDTSDNIEIPKVGQQYMSNKNIVYLFKTEIKKVNY